MVASGRKEEKVEVIKKEERWRKEYNRNKWPEEFIMDGTNIRAATLKRGKPDESLSNRVSFTVLLFTTSHDDDDDEEFGGYMAL